MRGLIRTVVLLAAAGLFCWQAATGQSRAVVDFRADNIISVPSGDSTVTALVGNVAFYHNGAILTCDSMVRFNADYFEFFYNVIINKDSTYVYGDRADYNGITNIAQVYAPIIKTVDGDMTMYSYDMEFNTLTNIGRYSRGGTISQKDNLMESMEAIYHSEERDIFFVRDVVMRNEEYLLRTDSMGYNFDSEFTTFYRPAQIWNKDGDFLSADRGHYDRARDIYTFTENSYILTEKQEIFADSITYLRTAGLTYLYNNIQIHDREQRGLLFGDYGIYWVDDQQAILTENPSGIGYDEAEQPDSVYLRGDWLYLHTIPSEETFTEEIAARLTLPGRGEFHPDLHLLPDSAAVPRPDSLPPDSLSTWGHLYGEGADSTRLEWGMRGTPPPGSPSGGMPPGAEEIEALLDSLRTAEGMIPDSTAGAEHTEEIPEPQSVTEKEITSEAHTSEEIGAEETVPQAVGPDQTAEPAAEPAEPVVLPDTTASTTPQSVEPPDDTPKTKRELRRERRLERRKEQMVEYAREQGLVVDSLPEPMADSLLADTLPPPVEGVDTLPKDSLQRIVRAVGNVRTFRHDLQAICDSLVAFSADSTARMYGRPVLWSEQSQIASDEVHFFSANGQLERAEFLGNPIMSQLVIDSLFNQIVGDTIVAFFKDREIRRMEVMHNAKTYYYMQEEGKPELIGGFLDMTSQDITIRFDSTRVSHIVPKVNPAYSVYPMLKIPGEHPRRFPNFRWYEHLRPRTLYDVFDRTLRDSQREQSESIPYPQFRITDRMEERKKTLIEQGQWRDRSETIWIDPSYFHNF